MGKRKGPLLYPLILSFLFSFNIPSKWRLEGHMNFTPENLYKYLDGGADKFIKAGVKELQVYFLSKDEKEVVVEIYKFSYKEKAREFFRKEYSKEKDEVLGENELDILKGRYFLRTYSYATWKGIGKQLREIASCFLKGLSSK